MNRQSGRTKFEVFTDPALSWKFHPTRYKNELGTLVLKSETVFFPEILCHKNGQN